MRQLVRQEMQAGALGIGSSLIYAPDSFASTEELIELCKVAAEYQRQVHLSHAQRRRQADRGRRRADPHQPRGEYPGGDLPPQGRRQSNWPKMDRVLEMVEAARASGLKITADMYMYPAGATGFNAAMPPSALDGGCDALFKRLRDPAERAKIKAAMMTPTATGRTCIWRPARRSASCSLISRTRSSSHSPATRSPRSRRRAGLIRTTPFSTSSSRTSRASALSTS